MANKTFNIVGVSRVRENAPLKLRVANGTKIDNREKVLKRNGHADVFLVMLDTAVDKVGARDFLATNHPTLFAQLKPAKVKGETEDTVETTEGSVETTEGSVETTEDTVETTEDTVETTEDTVETTEGSVEDTVETSEDAVVETEAEVETSEDAVVETETEVETTEDAVVELTPEQKLAARRARDAARKREKRAAAKAALVSE